MNNDPETLARDVLAQEDGSATGATLAPVTIGMSEASVFRVAGGAPRFVKVATGAAASALRDEITRTQWLAAQAAPVPRLLRIDDRGGSIAVLMAAIAGQPADVSALQTPSLVAALAKALATLHALPTAACPFDETVARRLARAAAAIAAGDIDPAQFEEHHRDTAAADLLRRLQQAPLRDDMVVLHGDAMLGNIMIDDNGKVGFIDCGNAGRGERHIDLALLHADIVAHRGEDGGRHFLTAYGASAFDAAKARYVLDLYELF